MNDFVGKKHGGGDAATVGREGGSCGDWLGGRESRWGNEKNGAGPGGVSSYRRVGGGRMGGGGVDEWAGGGEGKLVGLIDGSQVAGASSAR